MPESVKAEVVTARMMDPGGDPDWKVEKAEARTRIENDNTRICLRGYCQGPLQFQCEIQVRASWQETADPPPSLSCQPLAELGAVRFGQRRLVAERHGLFGAPPSP